MKLKNKTALVPGASRAVGRAIAKKLASEGARLVLPVFDWPESCVEMEREFTDLGFDYISIPTNLTIESQVINLVKIIKKKFKTLDFLVNNIERGGMPIVHGSYDHAHNEGQWDLEVATTLKAKWLLFHHCFPLMRKAVGGAIVNLSSIAGITGRSGPAELLFNDGYSAANRAISSFTETWAREAAPDIRVNELTLGLIKKRHGEETKGWATLTAEQQSKLKEHILLGRTGLPEEVAETVFFLLYEAKYITGATLRMDGGYMLGGAKTNELPPGILENEK
jgi:3-oxoacyl-[acyl-carrier protein] reductase